MRNRAPLRSYIRNMLRALWWPYGGLLSLMSEVPLYVIVYGTSQGSYGTRTGPRAPTEFDQSYVTTTS